MVCRSDGSFTPRMQCHTVARGAAVRNRTSTHGAVCVALHSSAAHVDARCCAAPYGTAAHHIWCERTFWNMDNISRRQKIDGAAPDRQTSCSTVRNDAFFLFYYVSNYCFFVIGGQHRWALCSPGSLPLYAVLCLMLRYCLTWQINSPSLSLHVFCSIYKRKSTEL